MYKNFSLIIKDDQIDELDNIDHNVTVKEKYLKYGLSAKNEMPFKEIIPYNPEEAIPNTSTENLFELLNLDKDSSYESMVLKFRTEFQHGIYNKFY